MKTLHTYMKEIDGQIPQFHPHAPEGTSTSKYWLENGIDDIARIKLSEAVTATYEQIDDLAERLGLQAWQNWH